MREDIDRAIDDVARRLTAGEPDGAFRARVQARIESGESTRRRWSGAWVISPLAAALVVAVVVVVTYERDADHRAQQTVRPSEVAQQPTPITPTVRLKPDT